MVQVRESTGLVCEFDPKKIIASISKVTPGMEMSNQKYKLVIEIVLENIRDLEVIDSSALRIVVEQALCEVDYTVAQLYKNK